MGFYEYFLERILKKHIDTGKLAMSTTGGVWLQHSSLHPATCDALEETLQYFQVKPWLLLLEKAFLEDILETLQSAIEDVPWHVTTRCQPCPYLSDCRGSNNQNTSIADVDIRTLPGVSAADSRFLQHIALEYDQSTTRTGTVFRPATAAAAAPPSATPSTTAAASATATRLKPRYAAATLKAALLSPASAVVPTASARQRALTILGGNSNNSSSGNSGGGSGRPFSTSTASSVKSNTARTNTYPLVSSSLGVLDSMLGRKQVFRGQPCGAFPAPTATASTSTSGTAVSAVGGVVSVYLVLLCDPALDLPYAWGVRVEQAGVSSSRSGSSGTYAAAPAPVEYHQSVVFLSTSASLLHAEQQLLWALLERLCAITEQFASSGRAVTFYVWDSLDRYCLTQMLIKALCGDFPLPVTATTSTATTATALKQRLYYLAMTVLDFPQQWNLATPSPPLGSTGNLQQSGSGGVSCNDGGVGITSAAPRVCDVTLSYQSLLYLPIPGFYTPADLVNWVDANANTNTTASTNSGGSINNKGATSTDLSRGAVEKVWLAGENIDNLVLERLRGLSRVTAYLGFTVAAQYSSGAAAGVLSTMLYNRAVPLPNRASCMQAQLFVSCPLIQRLLFMKQVNLLVRCRTAREKRIAALSNAQLTTRLRCVSASAASKEVVFEHVSGIPVFADGSSSAYMRKWCLTTNSNAVVTQFTDMEYITELKRYNGEGIVFASIVAINTDSRTNKRTIHISTQNNSWCRVGDVYVLFARETDLTIDKSIDSLNFAASAVVRCAGSGGTSSSGCALVDLITDPNTWSGKPETFAGVAWAQLESSRIAVNSVYSNIINLNNTSSSSSGASASPYAKVGPLTSVQAKPFDMLLRERLTIVWGPPGEKSNDFCVLCESAVVRDNSNYRTGMIYIFIIHVHCTT